MTLQCLHKSYYHIVGRVYTTLSILARARFHIARPFYGVKSGCHCGPKIYIKFMA